MFGARSLLDHHVGHSRSTRRHRANARSLVEGALGPCRRRCADNDAAPRLPVVMDVREHDLVEYELVSCGSSE